MKKQIADYIKQLGAKCSYSGNTRTMYVKDRWKNLRKKSIAIICFEKFGKIPFNIVNQ